MNRAGLQLYQFGVSLIELIVFIVVVSVSLVGILSVFNSSMYHSVNPIVQISAIELAQAKMDEILARKFDAASPTGGVPACGSAEPGSVACAGILPNGVYDDVGDFDGQVESPLTGYTLTTSVANAGADLGLAADQARKITVVVDMPNGETIQLASYKVNF